MLGENNASKLTSVRVGVIGVGGVGSWSANALVRSGVNKITLVDPDIIVESNINRQCHADYDNLGKPKVVAMEEMLRRINPSVEVTGYDEEFCEANAKNDALLSKVRYTLRRHHEFPRSTVMKVSCITSTELSKKARAGSSRISCSGYGSIVTVTATMGLLAASEAITQIIKKELPL